MVFGQIMRMEERIVLDGVAAQPDSSGSATDATGTDGAHSATESATAVADPAADHSTDNHASTDNSDTSDSDNSDATDSANAIGDPTLRAILINDEIESYENLAGSVAENVLVYVYDGDSNSLEQILDGFKETAGNKTFDSIALATHSQGAGSFVVGSGEHVDLASFLSSSGQQAFITALGDMINDDGHLDMLSCNLSGNEKGDVLLAAMEQAAGVEIAASDDLTGNADQGGDWILEDGNIDAAALYFNAVALENFDSTLVAETKVANANTQGDSSSQIAIDGNYLIISSTTANSSTGAVYVYNFGDHDNDAGTADTWEQTFTLTAADGAANDCFGTSLDINGTTIAVGSENHNSFAGSVYIFNAETGASITQLNGEAADNYFGCSVALSDSLLVVGARGYNSDTGKVYIYNSSTGAEVRTLSDAGGQSWDRFGYSVDISGTTVVVGSPSSADTASVFVFNSDTGAKIYQFDADGTDSMNFGTTVAISGNTIAFNSIGNDFAGKVYIYDATTGNKTYTLNDASGGMLDSFGYSIAISGDNVYVGSYTISSNTGQVCLFSASTGNQLSVITASDGAANYYFGRDVAISGTTLAATAYGNGSFYIFSDSVPANAAPAGKPTIDGIIKQGQQLTAKTDVITDTDGFGAGFSYQWKADGVNIGENSNTYTLTQNEVGKVITVTVSYTDGGGTAESITSLDSVAVLNVNDAPTGEPVITGLAEQNQTLSADTSAITDLDGITGAYSYQWKADGVNIGVNSPNLLLSQSEVGKAITVTVSYTDDGGTVESITSTATSAVLNVNDAPVGALAINGGLTQGQELTADTSGITDPDGTTGVVYSYQWKADGVNIGENSDKYTLTQNEVGKKISVTVTYTDQQGTTESVTSLDSAVVANINDLPTGKPSIGGTAVLNQTLTASTDNINDIDGLTGVVYSYQWQADGVNIGGNSNSYTLTQDEVGKAITVTVSYTDQQGTTENITSVATAIVAASQPVVETPSEDGTTSETPVAHNTQAPAAVQSQSGQSATGDSTTDPNITASEFSNKPAIIPISPYASGSDFSANANAIAKITEVQIDSSVPNSEQASGNNNDATAVGEDTPAETTTKTNAGTQAESKTPANQETADATQQKEKDSAQNENENKSASTVTTTPMTAEMQKISNMFSFFRQAILTLTNTKVLPELSQLDANNVRTPLLRIGITLDKTQKDFEAGKISKTEILAKINEILTANGALPPSIQAAMAALKNLVSEQNTATNIEVQATKGTQEAAPAPETAPAPVLETAPAPKGTLGGLTDVIQESPMGYAKPR